MNREPAADSTHAPHPEWETLNDWIDDRLDDREAADLLAHTGSCGACRATVEALRTVRRGVSRLPDSIDPPATLWSEIAATIAATPGVVAATTAVPMPMVHRKAVERLARRSEALPSRVDSARAYPRRWLAAAAVLLVALSSALTALILGRRDDDQLARVRAAAPAVAVADAPDKVPLSFTATESAYLTSVADLHALFLSERSALSPATVAIVERALATLDEALAEARRALIADPANRALSDRLESTYRHKVELLRRAAEFPHSL